MIHNRERSERRRDNSVQSLYTYVSRLVLFLFSPHGLYSTTFFFWLFLLGLFIAYYIWLLTRHCLVFEIRSLSFSCFQKLSRVRRKTKRKIATLLTWNGSRWWEGRKEWTAVSRRVEWWKMVEVRSNQARGKRRKRKRIVEVEIDARRQKGTQYRCSDSLVITPRRFRRLQLLLMPVKDQNLPIPYGIWYEKSRNLIKTNPGRK